MLFLLWNLYLVKYSYKIHFRKNLLLKYFEGFLGAQWLRICLPVQGPRVQSLICEDPACCRAAKPVHHNYWSCALEPMSHNYWAYEPQLRIPRATTTEAHAPRAHALQQEKPPQWEAWELQQRAAPTSHNQRKARVQQRRPNAARNNK